MSVAFEVRNSIGIITIDRAAKLNALDLETFRRIEEIVDRANDDRAIRGLLFAAAPGRAFSAGADINDLAGLSPKAAAGRAAYRRGVFQKISTAEVPSVAVVDGFAMGGGVELALACTFPFSRSAINGIMAASRHSELPIEEGLAREGEELARLSTSPDGIEGVSAFLEKRAPVFNR